MFETKSLVKVREAGAMPVLNETMPSFGTDTDVWMRDKSLQLYWIRKTPEAIGIINRLITDIFTQYHFVPVQTKDKRKSKKSIDAATNFAYKQQLKSRLKASGIDWIALGDSYTWLGKIEPEQVKELISKFNVEFNDIEIKELLDEDFSRLSSIKHIPASMMEIRTDQFSITEFVQKARGMMTKDISFKPENIIHAKFMDLDGKAHGFTPMTASSPIIRTLGLIKDYHGNFFQYGGTFDWLFVFEGASPNDPNVAIMKEMFSQVRTRKHGNYFGTTGPNTKFNATKLNEFNSEMAFQDLAIYYTGVLALAFNMPLSTLQTILGIKIKGGAGTSDVEDASYWRAIDEAQDYIENLWNTQLWEPFFGVDIVFKRGFRQDDVRIAQTRMQNVGVAEFFMKHEFPVNDDFYLEMFEIPSDYRTEGDIKKEIEIPVSGSGVGTSAQKPNDKVMPGAATQKKNDIKKQEQNPS